MDQKTLTDLRKHLPIWIYDFARIPLAFPQTCPGNPTNPLTIGLIVAMKLEGTTMVCFPESKNRTI
jgi:hypothetical protein